jgi:formate dehydrogenase subunit gamma
MVFLALLVALSPVVAAAQQSDETEVATPPGQQTLQDILARQRGEDVPFGAEVPLPNETSDDAGVGQLGTLGGSSDPALWREMRADEADVTTQIRGPAAEVLMQDNGMWWLTFRQGPLITYGSWLLGGTLALLAIFYLIRGRIRIEHGRSGVMIERFKGVERFGHWLLAGSFILLGITGIISLIGRKFLIPAFGHEAFSIIAIGSKWIHNNVSWAFMLALILIFVMWVMHNLPDRTDINWLLKGGGIFGKGHPPAKKFNAGQKLIFWSVIVLGTSISVSGLSLLFPFEMPMFGATFAKMNALGLPQLFGFGPLETALTPQAEMQYAQLWHAIVSTVLLAVILAHIYIGTLGMEGAYEAMGSGEVDLQWAREHHSIWAEEVTEKKDVPSGKAHPAE